MSLTLSIGLRQQDKCGSLYIADTTGTYSGTNTTGWQTVTSGGANIEVDNSSITEATITIVTSLNTILIDLMDVTTWQAITSYPTGQPFDSSVTPDNLSYLLTSDIVGTLLDGVITVAYHIKDSNGNVSDNTFVACLYCKVKCGVYRAIDLIPDYYKCKNCSNTYVNTVVTMWGLYKALKLSACHANEDRFKTILLQLQEILATLNITC